jgi:hypothetical protein
MFTGTLAAVAWTVGREAGLVRPPVAGPAPRPSWPKWVGTVLMLVIAGSFLVVNWAAYQGCFQPEDFGRMVWTSGAEARWLARGLFSPLRGNNQLDAAPGLLVYHLVEWLAGLRFAWWVAVLHALHLLSVGLLWRWLRRLGLEVPAAAAGTLFFAFQPVAFEVYWRPAAVSDLLCGLFAIACLLCYAGRRWILAFVCFWLAAKAGPAGLLIPVGLAAYEVWRSRPAVRRRAGFFVAAFCLVALYFTSGLGGIGSWPAASWYAPLVWISLAFALVVRRAHPAVAAAFFVLLWWPWSYSELRQFQAERLAHARDKSACYQALAEHARSAPGTKRFLSEQLPPGVKEWEFDAALAYFYKDPGLTLTPLNQLKGSEQIEPGSTVILRWDPASRKLLIRSASARAGVSQRN